MKHFFVLGRNPELSRQEVLSFFKSRSRPHKEILFEGNILLIETNDGEIINIQEFGGVLKIGEILFEGSETELEKYLKKKELIPSDKFTYSVIGNMDGEFLKDVFKSERKMAMLKHGKNKLNLQDGVMIDMSNAEFNILIYELDKKILLGISKQNYSYDELEKRDMKKPVRREELAISPRLAKILVNLSEARPNNLLLDPFCGVGGILQEALLKRINVYGSDNNPQVIRDAEKNIKWILNEYKTESKYNLEVLDARKIPDLQFSAVATETPLGYLFKTKPNDNEARRTINTFEEFIIPVLQRIKKCKKPVAKIAITFPVIKNLRVDVIKVSKKSGLKITAGPFLESRPEQFISRDILVFE